MSRSPDVEMGDASELLSPVAPPAGDNGWANRRWVPAVFRRELHKEDLLSGLTVGVMVIPQAMAYAMLADLLPVYGLYTALVPPLVYALIGDSRHLHVGPVSMVSILTAKAIGSANVDVASKAAAGTLIALLAGLAQIAFGLLKLGSLVNFATLPIISGFTAGASVVVIVSQAQHIFGIQVPSGATTVHTALNTVQKLADDGVHLYSLGLGVFFLAALWFMKNLSARHPNVPALKAAGPLFIVVFGTALVHAFGLDARGVKIIGEVPSGLPSLTSWKTVFDITNKGPFEAVKAVAEPAVFVSFISFMESIAVAKTLAVHHGYEVEANKELVALGTANVAGSFFSAYAVAGAFSRSAVASGTGAKSQNAAIVAALVVAITLLMLTPLFYYLPKGVLSAIVVHAVWGLIKVSDCVRLRVIAPKEALLWIVAFCGTLFSVTHGLLLSVAVSILLVLRETSTPELQVLGFLRHPATHAKTYVPAAAHSDVLAEEQLLIVQIKGMLHGGACSHLKTALAAVNAADRAARGKDAPRPHVVFDMAPVTSMDTTAMAALSECAAFLTRGNPEARVCYVGTKPQILKMMETSFRMQANKEDHLPFCSFNTLPEAVNKFANSGTSSDMRSQSAIW
ncbi:Sulfate transporter 4.1 [Diplonema papillatum]|nr:Sulfate transporter 4.1 [Diplonema papillatum]